MKRGVCELFDRISDEYLPHEQSGHTLEFFENTTNAGGRLVCSCGWSARLSGRGNRAGMDYGIVVLSEKFAAHLQGID